MLTDEKRLQLVFQSGEFVRKLERMEMLGIQLSKLTGAFAFKLISATYNLRISWNYFGTGQGRHDEVTYVTLRQRKRGKWRVVMQYEGHYHDGRYMLNFDDLVMFILDNLSDEMEEMIKEAEEESAGQKEYWKAMSEV